MNSFKTHFKITSFFAAVLLSSGFALTSGPNLPEYNNFESVDATDLVNLVNGGFSWSLPVMTVPGPGLGFPLVLNYHANPNQKDEASWVGFGWNLQAGAITRQVNNIPDDFKNIVIGELINGSSIHGWSTSISYNGATVGISYRSGEGYGGTVGYDLLHDVSGGRFSATVTQGFGSAQGQTGFTLGVNTSIAKLSGKEWGVGLGSGLSIGSTQAGGGFGSAVVGVSMANNNEKNLVKNTAASLGRMGVSLSHQGGGSSGGGLAGGISRSTSVQGSAKSESEGFFIPAYIPGVGLFTLSHNSWTSWISGIENDFYYGFLYGDKPGMGCVTTGTDINCHRATTLNGPVKRHEFSGAPRSFSNITMDARLMKSGEDTYLVAAQGVSGAFKPFRKEDGDYLNTLDWTGKFKCGWDFWNGCGTRHSDRTKELERNHNLLNEYWNSSSMDGLSDVYWRYLDDIGGAEYTNPSARSSTATVADRSRKVVPTLAVDGRISGFTITSSNGTRYEFAFPLNNLKEVKTGIQSGNQTITTSQTMDAPYAYAWLLTAIKSPDYVDLDGNNALSANDIGGWVKFNYGDGAGGDNKKVLQTWRTPYTGDLPTLDPLYKYSPSPQTNGIYIADDIRVASSRNAATGMKEIAYLHSVETPSHRANFIFQPTYREDNWPSYDASTRYWPYQESGTNYGPTWTPTSTYSYSFTTGANNHKVTIKLTIPPGTRIVSGAENSILLANEKVDVKIKFNCRLQLDYYSSNGTCPTFPLPSSGHPITIDGTEVEFKNYSVGQDAYQTVVLNDNLPDYGCGKGSFSFNSPFNEDTKTIAVQRFDQNRSKALQAISLREKSTNTEVGYVKFETDYSLSPNTPNSKGATHGKLTLKKVQIGATQNGPFMPPFEFSYSNNPQFQAGSWVEFERTEWDRWGNKCGICSDTYHEPSIPWKNGKFDAGAWNLDKITTPSGAEVAVKYGPNIYKYIGKQPLAVNTGTNEFEVLVSEGGPDVKLRTDPPYQEFNMKLGNIKMKMAERGLTILKYRLVAHIEDGDASPAFISTRSIPNNGGGTYTWLRAYGTLTTSITDINESILPSEVADDIWLSFWNDDNMIKSRIEYKLFATVNDPTGGTNVLKDYANGAVVSELKFREPFSNTVQTTQYAYSDGVTASLPATFSDYNDARMSDQGDNRSLLGRGYEYFVGSPGVYYSNVTTTVNNKYKTIYRFLTPRSLGTMVGAPSQVAATSATGGQRSTVAVSDFTSLWGSLYMKEEYADGQSVPTRTMRSVWAYNQKEFPSDQSAALAAGMVGINALENHQENSTDANYYVSGAASNLSKYFGQQQIITSHRYFNKDGCYVNNCPQENIRTTQVVYKRFLPIISREESVQDGLQAQTFHYFPDFVTGRMLKSRVVNSDNSALVTSSVPAYYKYGYGLMRSLNMLDQEYSNTSYLYPPGERSGKGFNASEASNRAISSEVTMWRPFSKEGDREEINTINMQALRKFKTLQWKVDLNAIPRPALSDPFDGCVVGEGGGLTCNTALNGDIGNPWLLKEQVNRYDEYGHAIDIMDQRKVNTSSLYGHRKSLLVAVLENTPVPLLPPNRKTQAFHESFEFTEDVRNKVSINPTGYSLSTLNFKTGGTSLIVQNPPSMVCFDLGALEAFEEYEASVWYFDATDGTTPTDINATRPGIFLGKDAGCASENHPNGVSKGPIATPSAYNYSSRATGSKQWKRLSTIINDGQCGDRAQLTPAIVCLYASKGNSGNPVLYDELRVKPGKARMITYAYDIQGRMISTADIREVVTYFEYDLMGNLTGIRNDDGFLVSEQNKKVGDR